MSRGRRQSPLPRSVIPCQLFLPALVALLVTASAAPTVRQPTPNASFVPIPDLQPPASDAPGGPPDGASATPTPVSSPFPLLPFPQPSTQPEPSVRPDITPDAAISPEPSTEPVIAAVPLNPTLAGFVSRTANGLLGGLIAGFFLLFVLGACVVATALGRNSASAVATDVALPPVYTSPEPVPLPYGTPAPPVPSNPDPSYTNMDASRAAGPPVLSGSGGSGSADVSDASALGTSALGASALGTAPAGKDVDTSALPRGPTPPPHDYVLGAGPAATRTDFIDLRTKFERDEIGDNSAVLGQDHTGGWLGMAAATGPGTDSVLRGLPPPPEAVGVGGVLPPPVAAERKAAREGADNGNDDGKGEEEGGLPDRAGGPTFDSQERLMAGGDGSGAISDAALSLTAASIAEESGDVPNLETDPIAIRRDRDETF